MDAKELIEQPIVVSTRGVLPTTPGRSDPLRLLFHNPRKLHRVLLIYLVSVRGRNGASTVGALLETRALWNESSDVVYRIPELISELALLCLDNLHGSGVYLPLVKKLDVPSIDALTVGCTGFDTAFVLLDDVRSLDFILLVNFGWVRVAYWAIRVGTRGYERRSRSRSWRCLGCLMRSSS